MAATLIMEGSSYGKTSPGLILPFHDSLLYANIFGRFEGGQARNMAPGRDGGIAIGEIPPNGTYCGFDAANYVDTGIADRDAVTLMCVMGQDTQPNGVFGFGVSSYVDQARSGVSIVLGPASPHDAYGLVGYKNGNTNTNINVGAAPSGTFQFLVFRTSSAYGASFDNLTTGLGTGRLPLSGPRVLSGATYRIGRAPITASDQNGRVNIVAAAIFGRVLTDDEMRANAAPIQRQISLYNGLTV